MSQNGDSERNHQKLEAENARLRLELQERQKQLNRADLENARLQVEYERVKAERDKYLAELEKEWGAAVADIQKNGVDFETLISAVEKAMGETRPEDRHAG